MKFYKYFFPVILAVCSFGAQALAPASITITGKAPPPGDLADRCGGNANVAINRVNTIYPQAHDNFTIYVGGQKQYSWAGEITPQTAAATTYTFNYMNGWFPGAGFPANTIITATIETYASATLANPIYSSTISFNCTTGEIVEIKNIDFTLPAVASTPAQVPTLGIPALILGALSVIGAAGYLSRRRLMS